MAIIKEKDYKVVDNKELEKIPNALTVRTIEKAMNGIEVETVNSVDELFKNLDD